MMLCVYTYSTCTAVRVHVLPEIEMIPSKIDTKVLSYFRTFVLSYLRTFVRKYEGTFESTFVPSKVLLMSTVPYEDIDCSRTFLM
jgi:hypothetical protein